MTPHEQYLKEHYRYAQDALNFVIEDRSVVGDPLDTVDGYLRKLYKDWLARVEPKEAPNDNRP